VLITGWGSPRVDTDVFRWAPQLRAVVHSAGTLRRITTDALWERKDITVTTAAPAYAIPVAELTVAQILLAGKRSLAREASSSCAGSGTHIAARDRRELRLRGRDLRGITGGESIGEHAAPLRCRRAHQRPLRR